MKVIINNMKNEIIVKCPRCQSIFSYDEGDVLVAYGRLPAVECPCCKNYNDCYEYEEIDITKIESKG
ncbi:MAG: hypothetical protein IJ371_02980 [Clostridia bacterium]|nr:hypothetical protein [Clostridia bacterium]